MLTATGRLFQSGGAHAAFEIRVSGTLYGENYRQYVHSSSPTPAPIQVSDIWGPGMALAQCYLYGDAGGTTATMYSTMLEVAAWG